MLKDTPHNLKEDNHETAAEMPSFEELATLAQDAPEALEALRRKLYEQILQQAPEHMCRRLKGLQFKIDMERRRAKTPLASCLKLSSMMHESLMELKAALSNPQEFLRIHQLTPQPPLNKKREDKHPTAQIIPLFPNDQD